MIAAVWYVVLVFHCQDWAEVRYCSNRHGLELLGLSLANTFPYLGFQRLYFGGDVIQALPAWLKFLGGVQTILGGVFLFLMLLGIRNRFRLR